MTATPGWSDDSVVTSSISIAWAEVPFASAAQAAAVAKPAPITLALPLGWVSRATSATGGPLLARPLEARLPRQHLRILECLADGAGRGAGPLALQTLQPLGRRPLDEPLLQDRQQLVPVLEAVREAPEAGIGRQLRPL